jgi:hypothetical protein
MRRRVRKQVINGSKTADGRVHVDRPIMGSVKISPCMGFGLCQNSELVLHELDE